MYGSLPEKGYEVDHKDGNGTNNKKTNLRVISRSRNCHNRTDNRGECPRGVFKSRNSFGGALMVNGKNYRKQFSTMEEAMNYRKMLEDTFLVKD